MKQHRCSDNNMFFREIGVNGRQLMSVISFHEKHKAKPKGNLCLIPLTTLTYQTTGGILILKFTLSHRI